MKNSNRFQTKLALASLMVGTLSLGLSISAHAADASGDPNLKSSDIYIGPKSVPVHIVFQKTSDTKVQVVVPQLTSEGGVCPTCDGKLVTMTIQPGDFENLPKLDSQIQNIVAYAYNQGAPQAQVQAVAAPAAPNQDDIDAHDHDKLDKALHECDSADVSCLSQTYVDIVSGTDKNRKVPHIVSPTVAVDILKADIEPNLKSLLAAANAYQPNISSSGVAEQEKQFQNQLGESFSAIDKIMADLPKGMTAARKELLRFEKEVLLVRAEEMKKILAQAKSLKTIGTDQVYNSYLAQEQKHFNEIATIMAGISDPNNNSENVFMGVRQAIEDQRINSTEAEVIYNKDFYQTALALETGVQNAYRMGPKGQMVLDPDQISLNGAPAPAMTNTAPTTANAQTQRIPGFNGVPGGVKPGTVKRQ